MKLDSLQNASAGVYVDRDGDKWTRRPVGAGAFLMVEHTGEVIEWPEDSLCDSEDFGPFELACIDAEVQA